jgi:FkbH-like protein
MSDEDAFRELRVELNFEKNALTLVPRATELSNKTNQFNFGIKRLTDFEIRSYIENPQASVVLASLKDKYADSGFVSLMCLNLAGEEILFVEEFCVSCRALGRGLEDEIFFGSLLVALQEHPSLSFQKIQILYREGDRNSPVIEWAKLRKWEINSNYVEIPFNSLSTWNSQLQ